MRRCLNAFLVAILSLSLSVDAARACWRTRHASRMCPPAACVTTIIVQSAPQAWCEPIACPPGCTAVIEMPAACCGEVVAATVVDVVDQPHAAATAAPAEPAGAESAAAQQALVGPAAVEPEVPTLRPALPDEGVQAASNDVPVAEPSVPESRDPASRLPGEAAAAAEEPEMKDEPGAAVPVDAPPVEPPPADEPEAEEMKNEEPAPPAIAEPTPSEPAAEEPEMREDEAPAADNPTPPSEPEQPATPAPGDEPDPVTEPPMPPGDEPAPEPTPAEEPNPFDDDEAAAPPAAAEPDSSEPEMKEDAADPFPAVDSEPPLTPFDPVADPTAAPVTDPTDKPAVSDPLAELLAEPATEDTEEMTEEPAAEPAADDAPGGDGAAEPAAESDVPAEPPAEPAPADDFAAGEPSRRWIHASGCYVMVATLVDIAADGACLLETDGRRIRVPLKNLSEHDRDYVRQAEVRLAARKAAPAATETAGL